MQSPATLHVMSGGEHVALAGIRVERVLSADLFVPPTSGNGTVDTDLVARRCHDRWTDLCDSIAALPEPLEALQMVSSTRSAGAPPELCVAYLALGRGATEDHAVAAAVRSWQALWSLLVTTLDYAELRPIASQPLLGRLASLAMAPHVCEVRRRVEALRVSHGVLRTRRFGFDTEPSESVGPGPGGLTLDHLFPWVPSNDPWRRLLEALRDDDADFALITHLRGFDRAPDACLDAAQHATAAAERLHKGQVGGSVDTVLAQQVVKLHEQALSRLGTLQGRTIAARLFLASSSPPSPALVATVLGSIDDASVRGEQPWARAVFRGGADVADVPAASVLAPLDAPSHDILFGVRDATAVVRTPMPSSVEVAGMPLNRARTAPLTGVSGQDYPIGTNVHRGTWADVALDAPMRFRHTYVVGQTGTGKSTLLANMILHDIDAGRGVGVLDPHGSLIDDVLLRFPPERADDLVLVDLTDTARPVPFNILCIQENDPQAYRLERDLIIDDIFCYMQRTFAKETMGPMFETHLRGFLTLLIGFERPAASAVPNLTMFRALYTKTKLLRALAERHAGTDPFLDTLVKEALGASYDASISNMAGYITSKLSRFFSDVALRNITCQDGMIDVDAIVNQGKVLLLNLGKGRFGEVAAGLLASQVVSRIRSSAMKRGAQTGARPFYLYADEFQIFADDRFAELLAEARKFGLALTIAHQFTRQLPDSVLRAVLGNVGTTITLRVGAQDAEALEPLYWPSFNRRDLTSLASFHAAVRSFGALGAAPFSVALSPLSTETNPAAATALRRASAQRYGTDRAHVEAHIVSRYQQFLASADD